MDAPVVFMSVARRVGTIRAIFFVIGYDFLDWVQFGINPPPLNWFTLMLRNGEEDHDGKENLLARRDCRKTAAG